MTNKERMEKIDGIRKDRGILQSKLCDKAGVAPSNYSLGKTGKQNTKDTTIMALCDVLDIDFVTMEERGINE